MCAEEKFRRVKLGNPKIKAALVDVPGAVHALLVLGWAKELEPEEAVVVPKGRHFSMAEAGPLLDSIPTEPSRPLPDAQVVIRAVSQHEEEVASHDRVCCSRPWQDMG